MQSRNYIERRGELETYFNRTAAKAWERLTSDAPVSGIRATVRAGRNETRSTLLSWLPDDLTGLRILDAGCGTGALSVEMARRGATVVAVDLSESLIQVAKDRVPEDVADKITFRAGDMLDDRAPGTGEPFDHIVAMDALIHYDAHDMVTMITRLAARSRRSILFTFAPKTMLLTAMHEAGKWLPGRDHAPAIVPVSERHLRYLIGQEVRLHNWLPRQSHRVSSAFYKSHVMELAHI